MPQDRNKMVQTVMCKLWGKSDTKGSQPRGSSFIGRQPMFRTMHPIVGTPRSHSDGLALPRSLALCVPQVGRKSLTASDRGTVPYKLNSRFCEPFKNQHVHVYPHQTSQDETTCFARQFSRTARAPQFLRCAHVVLCSLDNTCFCSCVFCFWLVPGLSGAHVALPKGRRARLGLEIYG